MNNSKHEFDRIADKLRVADANLARGNTVAETCQVLAISRATYYRWKNRYDGVGVIEMQRIKVLEEENVKLRKQIEQLSLEVGVLHEVLRGKA